MSGNKEAIWRHISHQINHRTNEGVVGETAREILDMMETHADKRGRLNIRG